MSYYTFVRVSHFCAQPSKLGWLAPVPRISQRVIKFSIKKQGSGMNGSKKLFIIKERIEIKLRKNGFIIQVSDSRPRHVLLYMTLS